MKHFNISLLFTVSFLLMFISCQKSDLVPDDSARVANMLKGGNLGGSSGYDLEAFDNQMQTYGLWQWVHQKFY